MDLAARLAANGYLHFGKCFENDHIGAQPGRNRLACMRTASEDIRHAVQSRARYSSPKEGRVSLHWPRTIRVGVRLGGKQERLLALLH